MIEYKGYTGVFEYDPSLEMLTGHVIDIRDEIYFEGKSIDEVKSNMAELVDEYLRVCEELGDEPAKPYSGNLRLRMDPAVHRAAALAAASEGDSLNGWITKILRGALGERVAS